MDPPVICGFGCTVPEQDDALRETGTKLERCREGRAIEP